MKYKNFVGLVALAVGVHMTCLAEVYTAEPYTTSLDGGSNTVQVVVNPAWNVASPVEVKPFVIQRTVNSTNAVLPYVYRKGATDCETTNWFAKVACYSMTFRLKYKPLQGSSYVKQEEKEFTDETGTCSWVPPYKTIVTAELVRRDNEEDVEGVLVGTAILDFTQSDLPDPKPEYTVSEAEFSDVALDTRALQYDTEVFDEYDYPVPRRVPYSVGEVLRLAHDIQWTADEGFLRVSSLSLLTKIAVTNETGQTDSFKIQEPIDTIEWKPVGGSQYALTLFGKEEGDEKPEVVALSVIVDLRALDVVLEGLPDDANSLRGLTVSNVWLKAYGVDPAYAANTNYYAQNGLPIWKSYLFNLDPTNEFSLAFTRIEQVDDDKFELELNLKSGEDVLEFLPRTDLADFKYRLISTNELSSAFVNQLDGEPEYDTNVFTVDKLLEEPQQFYRARLMFYWKKAE